MEDGESDIHMEDDVRVEDMPHFLRKDNTNRTRWHKYIPRQNIRYRAHI